MKPLSRNTIVVTALVAVIAVMIGLVAASEPLYRMFCSATGLGGTTQRSATSPAQMQDRSITVSFDGNVDPTLPWDFAPETRHVKVRLGEETLVKFRAHNHGPNTTVGTAVHNVQPDKVGLYFDKTQCFCFTRQTLKSGQSAEFAVQFYIDPEMAKDHNDDDVMDITLSYTFYLAKDQEKAHTGQESGADQSPAPSN